MGALLLVLCGWNLDWGGLILSAKQARPSVLSRHGAMHLLPTPSQHLAGIIRPAFVLKHNMTGVVLQHGHMLCVARPVD